VNSERRPQGRRPYPRRLPDRWGLDRRGERWDRRSRGDEEPRQGRLATPRRRLIAVLIGLTLLGGTVAIAQMSSAGTRRGQPTAANCTTAPGNTTTAPATTEPTATEAAAPAEGAAAPAEGAAAPAEGAAVAADDVHQHDGANVTGQQGVAAQESSRRGTSATCTPSGSPSANPPVVQPDSPGASCDNSNLPLHDGFQNGNRCVTTERGEVPSAENVPSLLIVSSPFRVRVNQPFEIRISTRNLVRDFFVPAGAGGYYITRSFLTEDGIPHGHVHTSIIALPTTRSAPDVSPVPTFFLATEDGKGSKTPDTFVVRVPGIATPGLYKITSWAGDASHAVPMSQRANQTPAVDSVRLIVTRR
jgi:hypothetical protein